MPTPPVGVPWECLGLDIRTRNVLSKSGFDAKPHKIGELSVGDVIAIRGFGESCLQSYLEAAAAWPQNADGDSHVVTDEDAVDPTILEILSALESGRDIGHCHWLPIPRPPEGTPFHRLGFDKRTKNALKKAGFDQNPQSLGELTVGDILSIRGFGVRAYPDICGRRFRGAALRQSPMTRISENTKR